MTSPPGLGALVYLASALVKVQPQPVQTFPDTPNQYSGNLSVIGDPGGWDLSALAGEIGPAGRAFFALRNAYDVDPTRPVVNTIAELPTDLTNLASDIGLYWVLDTLDTFGHVIMTTAWVWYGTSWRAFMTGAFGPPGPVPLVRPTVFDITPGSDAYIATSGPTLEPTWDFYLPVPAGPVGPIGPLGGFGDVNETTIVNPSVLGFTGTFTEDGEALWEPMTVNPAVLATYSMPQSAFTAQISIAQYLNVGTFTVPAQAYDWTPAVWGHLCAHAASGQTSQKIGALVILGDDSLINTGGIEAGPGTLIGRGLGSRGGEVNIFPHYSTPQTSSVAISPTNNRALVPAGSPATLNVGLWNDGHLGFYTFSPTASPPPLTTLVTNVANAVKNPIATLDNVGTALSNWVSSIHSDLQNAMNTVARLLSGIHLPSAISNVISTLKGVPADIRAFVQTLPADVAGTLANFKSVLNNVADKLGLSGVPDALSAVAAHLASGITSGITNLTTAVQGAIDSVANSLGLSGIGHPTNVVSGLVANFQSLLNTAAGALGIPVGGVSNLLSSVQQGLRSLGATISGTVQNAIDGLGNALGLTGTGLLGSVVSNLLGDFQGVLTSAANGFGLGQLPNPFTGVGNALADLASNIEAGLATMTADIQSSIDSIAQAFGSTGIGNPITSINAALSTLQPALDNLAAQLGMVTLPALQSSLSSFAGTVTTDIQDTLDTLTNAVHQGVGHTVSEVHTIVGNIQTAIDNVASHLGLSGIGHTVQELFSGLLARIGSPLGAGLSGALNTLGNLIGIPGLISTIDGALVNLEPLLGSTLSRFTTDAQVFINVIPINPSPFTFLGTEG